MTETRTISQKWEQYRPSKALWLWSCAGCVAATMLLGFTAGGWVTGGTANEMVDSAAGDARAELAATLCVDKFLASANAGTQLTSLKDSSSWERDDFIEDGGWSKISGMEEEISGASDICADRLVAMEDVPARVVAPEPSVVEPTTSDG